VVVNIEEAAASLKDPICLSLSSVVTGNHVVIREQGYTAISSLDEAAKRTDCHMALVNDALAIIIIKVLDL